MTFFILTRNLVFAVNGAKFKQVHSTYLGQYRHLSFENHLKFCLVIEHSWERVWIEFQTCRCYDWYILSKKKIYILWDCIMTVVLFSPPKQMWNAPMLITVEDDSGKNITAKRKCPRFTRTHLGLIQTCLKVQSPVLITHVSFPHLS